MRGLVVAMVLAGIGGGAVAETTCQKPAWPDCAFDMAVWNDEGRLAACFEETSAVFDAMSEYRTCLWEYRDDVIFEVEGLTATLAAELATYQMFTSCMTDFRSLASPDRCDFPPWVENPY